MDTSSRVSYDDILIDNLPQISTTVNIDDIKDVDLLSANEESERSGSIIPLLKQELKCKIQSRRLTEGKEELSLTHNASSIESTQLSPAEIEKKNRRKKQNCTAARKFRLKEKERITDTRQEIEVLEVKNGVLRQTLSDLITERNTLRISLQEHDVYCCHGSAIYADVPVP